MQIATLFVFCLCIFLIEGKDESTRAMDVEIDIDVLRELESVRDELQEERKYRYTQDQLQKRHMSEVNQMLEKLRNGNALAAGATKKSNEEIATAENRFTAIGCNGDTLHLSCSKNRKIEITTAYFGVYEFACADGCCPPTPYKDCTAEVRHTDAAKYLELMLTCNTKEECDNVYVGARIPVCEDEQLDAQEADYMHVYYDCIPGIEGEHVGFTAHATTNMQYKDSEIVRFDDAQTNIGGYYNTETSSFQCPYSGIYMFSVSFTAFEKHPMEIEIVRNEEVLSESIAYGDAASSTNTFNHAGAQVIVECQVGQVVYARCSVADGYLNAPAKATQFSGYLLERN